MVTMRAAVFQGAGQIEVQEVPRPEVQPDGVVIRVAYCGICGSDLEAYQTGMYEPGMIIGHELSGTIVERGDTVTDCQVGDRVVVNDELPCGVCVACREGHLDQCESLLLPGITEHGGFAEYTRCSALSLHKLPDTVTLRQGALVEPLAVALHGVRRSAIKPGDRVLVMGAGPIGLFTLQCALLAGARMVAVTEIDPTRAELACRLGATVVLNPARENVGVALGWHTDGRGPEVVYVCTGAPNAMCDAISLVRKGGQISVLGVCVEPVPADFMTVAMSELSIVGNFAGRAEFPAAIDFIAQRRVNVDALVSDEIPLEDIVPRGFERLQQPGSGAVKILVRLGGEE